nr:hypothetical protein lw1 [Daucus carota subsp. sativus]
MWRGYCTLGPPNATCAICRAVMWDMERNNKSNRNAAPSFSLSPSRTFSISAKWWSKIASFPSEYKGI